MRFIITGRNIDVTEGLKSAVEEKLGKLDRFFAPETEVNVTLSVEKERQKIEVTIPVKGNIIRSYDPCERKHHPCGRVQQRYVCFHRFGRRSYRTSAQKVQE